MSKKRVALRFEALRSLNQLNELLDEYKEKRDVTPIGADDYASEFIDEGGGVDRAVEGEDKGVVVEANSMWVLRLVQLMHLLILVIIPGGWSVRGYSIGRGCGGHGGQGGWRGQERGNRGGPGEVVADVVDIRGSCGV